MAIINLRGRYYRFYPPERYLGYDYEDFQVDTDKAVFLVVDVYGMGYDDPTAGHPPGNQSSSSSGPSLYYLLQREKDVVVNHIRPAMDAARQIGFPVVYVSNSAPRIALKRSEFGKQRKQNVGADLEDLFGEDCIDPKEYEYGTGDYIKYSKIIEPQPGDYYIRKHTYSGFFDTRLDTLLRNLDTKILICVGFALDFCLLGTMLDGLYRNYKIVLLRDCTLACDLPEERETLSFTNRMILWAECAVGVTLTSQEFIDACRRASR